MLIEPTANEEVVAREAAFALTLGGGLTGAALGDLLAGPGIVPLAWLIAFGLTSWLGSSTRTPGGQVGLACAGALVSLWVAHEGSAELLYARLPLAAPAGLGLAFVWWSLIGRLRALFHGETHEDADVARVVAARWLLGIAVLAGCVAALESDLGLAVATVLTGLFAAARWTLGRDALTTRRRRLTQIRDVGAIGWEVVARDELDPLLLDGLRPLVRALPLDGVLVRTGPGGPYRGGIGGTPVALVPYRAFRFTPIPRALTWVEVREPMAIVGALFAPYLAVRATRWFSVDAFHGGDLGVSLGLAACVTLPALLVLAKFTTGSRKAVWACGLGAFLVSATGIALGG